MSEKSEKREDIRTRIREVVRKFRPLLHYAAVVRANRK